MISCKIAFMEFHFENSGDGSKIWQAIREEPCSACLQTIFGLNQKYSGH